MLAYRRAPLRQSIVIWSCGPWRSPWRVASTTWPRPLQTCTLGVQWEGRGCVYVHIDTGVLMVVWYIFSTCQMLKCDHHISPWSPYAQPSGSWFSSENSWRSFGRTWGTAGLHRPSGTSRAFNLEGGLGHHPPPSLEDGFFWGCSRLGLGFI